jgi:hypothetical protein
MTPTLAGALGLVRGWTRLYTSRMAPALRDARRAEIESDLWEFHEDARRRGATPTGIAVHMLLRLLLGIRHDLLWRAEHDSTRVDPLQQALWAAAVASLVTLWLVMSALQTKEPPLSPVASHTLVRLLYPMHVYPTRLPFAPASSPETPNVAVHVTFRSAAPPPPPPPPQKQKPAWR